MNLFLRVQEEKDEKMGAGKRSGSQRSVGARVKYRRPVRRVRTDCSDDEETMCDEGMSVSVLQCVAVCD